MSVFGIVRSFKLNTFCPKIKFSETQHAISEFCFFLETGVFFLCYFFSNLFSSKPPPLFFTTNETFCEHKGLLRVLRDYVTYRRPSSKKLSKSFEKNSSNFLKGFWLRIWRIWVFCCFQLGKNGFRVLCVSLRVFFGAVKLMKF